MSKIIITTLFTFVSLLMFAAYAGGNVVTADADHYENLLEHEQKTLEQAKILEEVLSKKEKEEEATATVEKEADKKQ